VAILAGGQGTRFWPRSLPNEPKQFLRVLGSSTLLQDAYARAHAIASEDHVFVVAPQVLAEKVRQQIPGLGDRMLIEPAAKDTALAVVYTLATLEARLGKDCVVAFLPADHYVADNAAFATSVRLAVQEATTRDRICLVGLVPTRPEVGYGYILTDRKTDTGAYHVGRFVEKPEVEVAQRLIAEGALWNVGITVAPAGQLLAHARRLAPEYTDAVDAYLGGGAPAVDRLARRSIEYAVLEHLDGISVIRATFGWDDVGTWTALDRIREHDTDGNVVDGAVLAHDTENCILVNATDSRILATLGANNLVCVTTEHATLVATKDHVADMKQLTARIEREYAAAAADRAAVPEPEDASRVDKAWGHEVWWAQTDQYVGKILYVRPHEALSLQYHNAKHESMLVVSGTGVLQVDDRELPLKAGLSVDIPPGVVHRLVAADQAVTVVEVSTPEVWDVVRLEDRYGRVEHTA
jgi:mannose-1-phosphate guanylyltransferase